MGIFRKQTARAPLTTVLLVLLLALSIGASSIGFVAWVGGQKQFETIDSQYTTIGILSGANWEKLLQVGLTADQLGRLPNMLSGGEIILADEPTGNLDSTNSRNIVEILRNLAHDHNRCAIIVTHDPAVAEAATRTGIENTPFLSASMISYLSNKWGAVQIVQKLF